MLTVDERTPPVVVPGGTRPRRIALPRGTEVVYPADTSDAIPTVLAEDTWIEPVLAGLRPGSRLTIAVSGLAEPASSGVDVRRLVSEAVLARAAAAGIDDVVVLVGNGVGPRPGVEAFVDLLGERIVRSFLPEQRLLSHDATEAASLVEVAPGVGLHRRLAESDLVVDVCVVGTDRIGPLGVADRLGSLDTQRLVRGWAARGDDTLLDPVRAAVSDLPIVTVAAVLEQNVHPHGAEFLGRREWEWTLVERLRWQALSRAALLGRTGLVEPLAGPVRRRPVRLLSGTPQEVAARAGQELIDRTAVEVPGQSDVLIATVPPRTPWNPGIAADPLVAAWSVLADPGYGAHTGTPAVRDGGVLIAIHPMTEHFSARVHPASADFFSDVLAETRDPDQLGGFEESYATDEWYRHLYRTQEAHAPVVPFQLWYDLQPALSTLSEVVWVGGSRAAAERLGFRPASTLADALEIASDQVGAAPSARFLHTPPALLADVRG